MSLPQDLLPLLPGTIARQIESQATNLSDLVVDAYEVFVSKDLVQLQSYFFTSCFPNIAI